MTSFSRFDLLKLRKNPLGFRCRQMQPLWPIYEPMFAEQSHQYARIERAIEYLTQNYELQPDLHTVADASATSPEHLQRLFQQWAGVSPKRFLDCLTVQHLKAKLSAQASLAEASEEVGLSGEARGRELLIRLESVTPSVIQTKGVGLALMYGSHVTPFGHAVVVLSDRGVTDLHFVEENEIPAVLATVQKRWPAAVLTQNQSVAQAVIASIFAPVEQGRGFSLQVFGTPFQVKVWQALLQIPEGQVTTYQSIAEAIGQPKAIQAVGNAVGDNPIAYLIPCHRVIRKSGVLGEYRWGAMRKRALLGYELSR
jgi:AraC family transcriptional regulator, regulatory protein of adaptative response / methylated-DNA-[protein]-cysteine methyltransferase